MIWRIKAESIQIVEMRLPVGIRLPSPPRGCDTWEGFFGRLDFLPEHFHFARDRRRGEFGLMLLHLSVRTCAVGIPFAGLRRNWIPFRPIPDGFLPTVLGSFIVVEYFLSPFAIWPKYPRIVLLYQSVSFSSCGHRTRLPQAADLNENFAAQILGCKVKTLTFGSYSRDILWPTKVETLAQVSYQPSGWPIKRIGVDWEGIWGAGKEIWRKVSLGTI